MNRDFSTDTEVIATLCRLVLTALRRILDDKFVASFGGGQPANKVPSSRPSATPLSIPENLKILTDRTVIIDGDSPVIVGTDAARGTDKGVLETVVYR